MNRIPGSGLLSFARARLHNGKCRKIKKNDRFLDRTEFETIMVVITEKLFSDEKKKDRANES